MAQFVLKSKVNNKWHLWLDAEVIIPTKFRKIIIDYSADGSTMSADYDSFIPVLLQYMVDAGNIPSLYLPQCFPITKPIIKISPLSF